jgi:Family of unknown function (DUF5678)
MNAEAQKDLELARRINHQARADPASPYAGKYVGILHHQVVAVANTLAEVEAQLEALGAGPKQGVCLEASADYDQTYRIWTEQPWRE